MLKGSGKLQARDYIMLGICVLLAFTVWLLHNLSLEYSDAVSARVIVRSEVGGHDNTAVAPSEVAVRCQMSGFSIISTKMRYRGHSRPIVLDVAPEDIHPEGADRYYMAQSDLLKYFHEMFGAEARLEYFITERISLQFPYASSRKVAVRAVTNITYRSQYMPVEDIRLSPDSVYVYAESDVLDAIDCVSTETINLEEVDTKVYGEVRLKPMRGVRISAEKVGYSIEVERFIEQNVELPVKVIGVPEGVNVRVYPVRAGVKVRSPYPGLASFDDKYVGVNYADFVESRNGKCVGRVDGLPYRAYVADMEPDVFECLIQVGR